MGTIDFISSWRLIQLAKQFTRKWFELDMIIIEINFTDTKRFTETQRKPMKAILFSEQSHSSNHFLICSITSFELEIDVVESLSVLRCWVIEFDPTIDSCQIDFELLAHEQTLKENIVTREERFMWITWLRHTVTHELSNDVRLWCVRWCL